MVGASELLCDPATRSAVSACRAITKARAGNFYWGLRLTPEPKRSAMYTIYAWMREADDLVDAHAGADSEKLDAKLAAFEASTVAALRGESRDAAGLWRALSAVAREYPLDPADFHAMLAGQRADLVPQRVATWPDLEAYCERVASTVGRVCVRVWGYRDGSALELATQLGIAFQLTNVLRDVREDALLGRTYLPQEALVTAGLSMDELLAWSQPEACREVLGTLVARARERFEASAPLDGMVDPACRATLRALTGIYRALLERMAGDLSQVCRGRVSLPMHRKVFIALRSHWLGRPA